MAAIVYAVVWIGLLLVARISSVAGIAAAVSAPISAFLLGERSLFPMLLGFALLVVWNHRANIARLKAGTEPRIGRSKVEPNDLIDRIRLLRTPGIGPITFHQLIARFGIAGAALAAVPDLARRGGGHAAAPVRRGEAEREVERVERLGARYLAIGQGLYPRAARRAGRCAAFADREGRSRDCSTGRRWRSSARATPRPPLPLRARARL